MKKIYHVKQGGKRTTVSIDSILSALLALKLGTSPETKEAHTVVRQWLQERLDEANDPNRYGVSQWLQEQVILFITEKELSTAYYDWILEQN